MSEHLRLPLSMNAVRLVEDADVGRHLVARTKHRQGKVLFSQSPLVSVLKPADARSRCHLCWNAPVKLLRCARCHWARYCSRKCQTKAWTQHKLECTCLQSYKRPVTHAQHPTRTPTVLLVARLALLLHQAGDSLEAFTALLTHWSAHPPAQQELYAQMAMLVHDFVRPVLGAGDCSRKPDPAQQDKAKGVGGQDLDDSDDQSDRLAVKRYVTWFARVACNAFTVCDAELRPVGLAVYPQSAMTNHSCRPSCVAMFEGDTLHVVAARDLQAGEEVSVSYLELANTTAVRQAELQTNYFFRCACVRCRCEGQERRREQLFTALRCPNKLKGGPCGGGLVVTAEGPSAQSAPGQPTEAIVPGCSTTPESHSPAAQCSSESPTRAHRAPLRDYLCLQCGFQDTAPCLPATCSFALGTTSPSSLPTSPSSAFQFFSSSLCSSPTSSLLSDLLQRTAAALLQLQQAQQGGGQEGSRILNAVEACKTLRQCLHSRNLQLMHALDCAARMAVDMQQWETAERLYKHSLPMYKHAYAADAVHPIIGLQLMSHGKLAWLNQHSQHALESFTQAAKLLRVTHSSVGGGATAVWTQLCTSLDQARAEAAHLRRQAET